MPDRNDPRRARDADTGDYGADEIRPFGLSREYSHPPAPPYWATGENSGRGRYYGRGPKGYRRSDERIREEVSDRLMTHPDVDASDIEVDVTNGVITLSGSVEDRHQKRISEFIAEDVVGVDDVRNQLTVRRGFWSTFATERSADREPTREPEKPVAQASSTGGRANAARGAALRDEQAR